MELFDLAKLRLFLHSISIEIIAMENANSLGLEEERDRARNSLRKYADMIFEGLPLEDTSLFDLSDAFNKKTHDSLLLDYEVMEALAAPTQEGNTEQQIKDLIVLMEKIMGSKKSASVEPVEGNVVPFKIRKDLN